MTAPKVRSLRIAVGTMLLGLGGCTASGGSTNAGDQTDRTNTGRVDPPQPETPPKQPGGCEPPDCHINPGPNEIPPEPKPEPTPEPTPPISVNPGPTPLPEPKPEPKPEPTPKAKPPREEPKHVNTGPQTSKP